MNVVVFKSKAAKQWFWHVIADNGEIIAQSEGYKRKAGAVKGIRALHCAATKPLKLTFEKRK